MATPATPRPAAASAEERTIRFQSNDLPRGNPSAYALELFRETVECDAEGAITWRTPPSEWRKVTATGAQIAPMVFTRADGSTFTGAQLMADLALAFDVIASA